MGSICDSTLWVTRFALGFPDTWETVMLPSRNLYKTNSSKVDSKIRMQIVHRINGVPAEKKPGHYGLMEFAVEKEKEILAAVLMESIFKNKSVFCAFFHSGGFFFPGKCF